MNFGLGRLLAFCKRRGMLPTINPRGNPLPGSLLPDTTKRLQNFMPYGWTWNSFFATHPAHVLQLLSISFPNVFLAESGERLVIIFLPFTDHFILFTPVLCEHQEAEETCREILESALVLTEDLCSPIYTQYTRRGTRGQKGLAQRPLSTYR